jgi:hypothetical protein
MATPVRLHLFFPAYNGDMTTHLHTSTETLSPTEAKELQDILAAGDFVELDFAKEFEKIGAELTNKKNTPSMYV